MDEVHVSTVVSVEDRARAVIDAWGLTVQGIEIPAAYLIRLENMIQASIRDALSFDRTLRGQTRRDYFKHTGESDGICGCGAGDHVGGELGPAVDCDQSVG